MDSTGEQPLFEPHVRQQALLATSARFSLYAGGIGSGKTTVGALRFLGRAVSAPGRGVILANSYEQLDRVALQSFIELAVRFGYGPKITRSRRRIELRGVDSDLFWHSTDNYNLMRGTEFGFFWLDEARDTCREAWWVIQGRLRGRGGNLRGDLTSTPSGLDHWLYEEFAGDRKRPDTAIVHGTSYDNAANLPPGYLRTLETAYQGAWFEQEVNAKFTNPYQGRCYFAFVRERHAAKPLAQRPGEAVHVGVDFNISPMSAVFGHCTDTGVEIFSEWTERDSNTLRLVEAIRSVAGAGTPVRVYPDASGAARRTSGGSDHELLRQAGFQVHAPAANPPQRDRILAVNLAFAANRLLLSPGAKELVRSLEATRWKPGSSEIDKTSNVEHLSDALGYLVLRLLPVGGPRTRIITREL